MSIRNDSLPKALLTLISWSLLGLVATGALGAENLEIDPSRELFITAVPVVDDERARDGKAWSFGGLMTSLSGDVAPEAFVRAWASSLIDVQVVNGDPIMEGNEAGQKEEAFFEFFKSWNSRRSCPGLDLETAPFRLLAIVNRPDLLSISNGQVTSAGEGRFIYQSVDPSECDITLPGAGSPERFFVIFEYDLPASSCSELKAWHEDWHGLSRFEVESEQYQSALAAITRRFTQPDPSSGRLNGSYLKQVRSNEFDLDIGLSQFWDLREWNLVGPPGSEADSSDAVLRSVTTKQTPSFQYLTKAKRNDELRRWLDLHASEILAGHHVVGDVLGASGSRAFLGGMAINDKHVQKRLPPTFPPNVFIAGSAWWAEGYSNDPDALPGEQFVSLDKAKVRHEFALQTCSGCHFWESGTDGFVVSPDTGNSQAFSMVSVRNSGEETRLSPFLTGTDEFSDLVNARVVNEDGGISQFTHEFNDLERRESVLRRILDLECEPGAGAANPITVLGEIAEEMGTRVH